MFKTSFIALLATVAAPALAVPPVSVGGNATVNATMNGAQTNFALGDRNMQSNHNGVIGAPTN